MDFLMPNLGNAPAISGASYAHRPGLGYGSAHEESLVIRALMMAVNLRKPPPGLVHHSDRGSQYTSHAYQALLKQHGMIPSMSRKGTTAP